MLMRGLRENDGMLLSNDSDLRWFSDQEYNIGIILILLFMKG